MIRTVGDLREALAEFPDYRELAVEVTVGGDLVADVVDLSRLEERIVGRHGSTALALIPAPDPYDVEALINDGLLLRARIEDGTLDRDDLEGGPA